MLHKCREKVSGASYLFCYFLNPGKGYGFEEERNKFWLLDLSVCTIFWEDWDCAKQRECEDMKNFRCDWVQKTRRQGHGWERTAESVRSVWVDWGLIRCKFYLLRSGVGLEWMEFVSLSVFVSRYDAFEGVEKHPGMKEGRWRTDNDKCGDRMYLNRNRSCTTSARSKWREVMKLQYGIYFRGQLPGPSSEESFLYNPLANSEPFPDLRRLSTLLRCRQVTWVPKRRKLDVGGVAQNIRDNARHRVLCRSLWQSPCSISWQLGYASLDQILDTVCMVSW